MIYLYNSHALCIALCNEVTSRCSYIWLILSRTLGHRLYSSPQNSEKMFAISTQLLHTFHHVIALRVFNLACLLRTVFLYIRFICIQDLLNLLFSLHQLFRCNWIYSVAYNWLYSVKPLNKLPLFLHSST